MTSDTGGTSKHRLVRGSPYRRDTVVFDDPRNLVSVDRSPR